MLRVQNKSNNIIFKAYLVAMFALMIVRYLFKIDVPEFVFLLVAMLPIWRGTISDQMAFVASCIPLSIAFQYKYALLILSVAILIKKRWKLKTSGAFILVAIMMVWELWHAFYGNFVYLEYLRDFAELIFLGIITSIDLDDLNYRLIIRGLTISVFGVCVIMLIMQMQQFGFNIIEVFVRSARSYRFGQSNMTSGRFALNFNANNLGFICNLATCGGLFLIMRKDHKWYDVLFVVGTLVFAIMTLSRAAIICAVLVFGAYLLLVRGSIANKLMRGFVGVIITIIAIALIYFIVPSIFENLIERFQRKDILNGRDSLFKYYNMFLGSSPFYLLFGVGMQHIYEKVSHFYPVFDVPHMGIQEVWVAWGLVGVVLMVVFICKLITVSKKNAGGKRQFFQFVPLILIIVHTSSGQLLTSSRVLMAFAIAFICLSVNENPKLIENHTGKI